MGRRGSAKDECPSGDWTLEETGTLYKTLWQVVSDYSMTDSSPRCNKTDLTWDTSFETMVATSAETNSIIAIYHDMCRSITNTL